MKAIQLIAGLMFLAAVSSLVHADTDKYARQAIQARYNQFDKAYMHKDFKQVEEILTPNCRFVLSGEGRSISTPKFLEGVKAMSKALTVSHARTRIVSLKATREGFETSVLWTGSSLYAPPPAMRQEAHPKPKNVSQSFRDTWRKTDKGWQISQRILGE